MKCYITHRKLNRINTVVAIIQKSEQIVKTYCKQEITKNAATPNGVPTVFVCKGFTCLPSVKNEEELRKIFERQGSSYSSGAICRYLTARFEGIRRSQSQVVSLE